MRSLAVRATPAALFLVLGAVLFLPSIFGGKVLSGSDLLLFEPPFQPPAGLERPSNPLLFDAAYVFEPDQLQVREALRGGDLPLWNPHLSAGRPLLAAQQSAPFFPLNWIGDVLPYHDSLVWIALLKLVLAALGTYAFCRALGLGRAPALLAGISFGFGAYFVAWLAHPHSNAYLLLPWLFLLVERICRRGRPADGVAFAAVLGAALLGGHPQSALIAALPLPFYAVWRYRSLGLGRRAGIERAVLLLGGTLFAGALAAIALVPFAEALRESHNTSRGTPPLAGRTGLALLFPEYWGRPDGFVVPSEPFNFAERTAYFGALPALLALVGLVLKRAVAAQVFFAVLGAVAALVAFNSGPLTDLARELPVLSDVALNRVLVLVAFSGAVLAGFGLERVLAANAAERRRLLVAVAVATWAPAMVWALAHTGSLSHLGDALGELPRPGDTAAAGDVIAFGSVLRWLILGMATIALLVVFFRRPAARRGVVLAAIALAAADLLVLDAGYHPSVDERRANPPAPAAVRALQREGGRMAAQGNALGPNTAARYGLRDARGHDLPVIERHQRLWAALGGSGFQRTLVDGGRPKLLHMFGVERVLTGTSISENGDAHPRAWVAYGWRTAARLEAAIAALAATPASLAHEEPVLEGAPPPAAGDAVRPTTASVTDESDTSVSVRLDARRPGYLVLLDTLYPGWKAEVDGQETKILPANAAFRAVPVAAGRHRVVFEYRPGSVYAGGIISILALALLLAVAFLARRSSRYGPAR